MAEDLERKYKTPIKKLANFFLKSRDKWKRRALNNAKRIEHLEKKIRDIKRSRDKWKQQAKDRKDTITRNEADNSCGNKALEGELILASDNDEKGIMPHIAEGRAKAHLYSLKVMMLGIQFIILAHCSLRGAMHIFKIICNFFCIETPSWVTIQNWLLRAGLYSLQKSALRRSDWIFILDNTVQIGTKKALIILGVSREHLKNSGYCLKHTDVRVFEIFPSDRINGEIVNCKIKNVADKTGIPLQIVADKGPDINLGINLFTAIHQDTIYTYDITHKTANMLKKLLESDPIWKSFQAECAKLKQKIQQTELAHLSPPKQRTKARYLNVHLLIMWAEKIIAYQKRNDFSSIKATYRLSEKVIDSFMFLSKRKKNLLRRICGITYKEKDEFIFAVKGLIGEKSAGRISEKLLKKANISKERFGIYFGWIGSYAKMIKKYGKIISIIEATNKHVKNTGIHNSTAKECESKVRAIKSRSDDVKQFKIDLMQHLKNEGKGISKSKALLGTSDIIESIFGKYKILDANSSTKGIGKMILSIPVFTTKITLSFIKEAMENVSQNDVKNWIDRFLGKSIISNRRVAFNGNKK